MTSCCSASRFRKPSFLAWLCFLAVFVTLIGLGLWQLDRLAWKEHLITSIRQGNEKAPLKTLPDDGEEVLFRKAIISGTFGADEFHVTPRYYNDTLGYHIFVPFHLSDGRHVMVNRGWVPAAQKEAATRPDSEAPKGTVTLTVQLREARDGNIFTPKSQPAKNVWFGRDTARMGEKAKLEVLPYSVDVLGTQDADTLPVPMSGEVKLRNDHLHYAVTWFLLAIGALIVFAVFHHKGKQAA